MAEQFPNKSQAIRPIEPLFQLVDNPSSIEVTIKINRAASLKEVAREIFHLSSSSVVTPWHLTALKQICDRHSPGLLTGKETLNSILKAGTEIPAGPLSYEIRQQRAEELKKLYQGKLLFANWKNAQELRGGIQYLEKVLKEEPPVFFKQTSKLEVFVGKLFEGKEIEKNIANWLKGISNERGDPEPPPKFPQNKIDAVIKALDSYVYSLPLNQRKKGIDHTLNLVERISPVFGIELTKWALDRANECGFKPDPKVQQRFLYQLAENLKAEHQAAEFEKAGAIKNGISCSPKRDSNIRASKEIVNLDQLDRDNEKRTNRVLETVRAAEKFSIENQLNKLNENWAKIGKPQNLLSDFLITKGELLALSKNPTDGIPSKLEALRSTTGYVPGISPETKDLKIELLASHARLEFHNLVKSLSKEKQIQVHELLSGIVSLLFGESQNPRADSDKKEKSLKQADVALQLLAQTTQSTETAVLEYEGLKAKRSYLDGDPKGALAQYREVGSLAELLTRGGVKGASSYLQFFLREQAILVNQINEKEISDDNITALSDIRKIAEEVLPKSRALLAELTLLQVQVQLQCGDKGSRNLLNQMQETFADLPKVQRDINAFLAEKSDSKLLAAIRTALGSYAASSATEMVLYGAIGALVGGTLGAFGHLGGIGWGIGTGIVAAQAILGVKNVATNWNKVTSSYETGLTSVTASTALASVVQIALEFSALGAATSASVKLLNRLVSTGGARYLASKLFGGGGGTPLAEQVLRLGLGETAFVAAKAKGPEYLEARASEYIQRLFRVGANAVDKAPLSQTLGAGMMVNQGRQIFAALFALETDGTLTPQQKSNGQMELAQNIAIMLAFVGTVKSVTAGTTHLMTQRIESLKTQGILYSLNSTRKSELPKAEPLAISMHEYNLRQPGFGASRGIFGEEYPKIPPSPSRAAPVQTSLGAAAPNQSIEVMAQSEKFVISTDAILGTSPIPEMVECIHSVLRREDFKDFELTKEWRVGGDSLVMHLTGTNDGVPVERVLKVSLEVAQTTGEKGRRPFDAPTLLDGTENIQLSNRPATRVFWVVQEKGLTDVTLPEAQIWLSELPTNYTLVDQNVPLNTQLIRLDGKVVLADLFAVQRSDTARATNYIRSRSTARRSFADRMQDMNLKSFEKIRDALDELAPKRPIPDELLPVKENTVKQELGRINDQLFGPYKSIGGKVDFIEDFFSPLQQATGKDRFSPAEYRKIWGVLRDSIGQRYEDLPIYFRHALDDLSSSIRASGTQAIPGKSVQVGLPATSPSPGNPGQIVSRNTISPVAIAMVREFLSVNETPATNMLFDKNVVSEASGFIGAYSSANELVGIICYSLPPSEPGVSILISSYVVPSARGGGIGQNLINEALNAMHSAGVATVRTLSVSDGGAKGIQKAIDEHPLIKSGAITVQHTIAGNPVGNLERAAGNAVKNDKIE